MVTNNVVVTSLSLHLVEGGVEMMSYMLLDSVQLHTFQSFKFNVYAEMLKRSFTLATPFSHIHVDHIIIIQTTLVC